ncbi:MAG: hypothetical protein ACI4HQ_11515 [Acetatifactor sp.]
MLHELRFSIEFAIAKNEKLVNTKEGIEISLLVRHLYEKLHGEEYSGDFDSDLCNPKYAELFENKGSLH